MVDPWAKNVDWSGGAAFELRGGSAPPVPGEVSEPALRLSISPVARFIYQDRVRGRELSIEYTPQVYMRFSQRYCALVDCRAPLQLHQLRVRYGGDLNRRWSWSGTAGGNLTQSDYSQQSAQLGSDQTPDAGAVGSSGQQGTLLDQPVIWTGGVSASVGLTRRLTRLQSLTVQPSATVQRLLSDVSTSSGAALVFDQTSADLSLAHAWVVSRIDTLTSTGLSGYAAFANGAQAYASATTAWRRRLRPRLDSELTGGAFFTVQLTGQSDGGTPVLPLGDYLLTGRLLERARLRLVGDVNVGTQAYFDPVQGSVLPLGGGGASIEFEIPPDLTAGLSASFYTPPLPATPADETEAANAASARITLTIRTPVTYQLDRHRMLEAGTMLTARGPHLGTTAPNGRFPQTEFWLYVAFRLDYTTARSPG